VLIAAPPERVFRALTTEDVTRWWGAPETYRTTAWTADLRPGGHWQARGVGAEGAPFGVEGEYLEVEPPRKIVQTWRADWDGGATTTVTYRLEAVPEGTRLTLRHEGFGDREASCRDHGQGWERVLGWLSAYLPPPPRPPDPSRYFLCRLLAPRATFMQDMSDAEREVMMSHAAYWKDLANRGAAVVFGPVLDPKGGWGVGIIRAATDQAVADLRDHDPAILSGHGFAYEILPMARAVFPD
jgi:uncharacterized protein YndB with AHSA1/START domain/uncharacterized protein YciI